MKKTILTLALLVSPFTFAATDIWEGTGTLFNNQGLQEGSYQLVVENTKNGQQIQSNVTVTLSNGDVHKQQCSLTETDPKSWKSQCTNGTGGGRCFGEGLCISYVEDASSGKAYATTIVLDGTNEMRLLRTELQNGKAVRFFREKLHKK